MVVVPIQFKYVQITKYSRDGSTIKICFNDGAKDHFIEKSADYDRADDFTEVIVNEARKIAKDANNKGHGILDAPTIRFTEDEEALYEHLQTVFSRVREEIRKVKTAKVAANLLQTVANLQGAKFNF